MLELPEAKEKRDCLMKFHKAIKRAFEFYEEPDVESATSSAIATFEYELSTTEDQAMKKFGYGISCPDKDKINHLKE